MTRVPPAGGGPGGFTVVEALLTLLLTALVLQGGWMILSQHRRAASWLARRGENLETVRTVAWLLSQELGGGRPGVDWGTEGGDSVGLRAFRGLGLVIPASQVGTRIRVCYRGLRSPNADKDSVLLMALDGGWRGYDLLDRAIVASPCRNMGEGWEEDWTLSAEPHGAVLGRVFEAGSYHLADQALRYRRGLGGRQPLTPPRILSGEFLASGPGAFPPPGGSSIGWEIILAGLNPEGEGIRWGGRAP